ncbi:ABC transporter substrate-binding protein [Ruminococcus sp.]|uniref:ABC transporter substrate-binding protein n=1 Tax=Ruminococcus sp. TaxID=41978 RepID=UPI0025D8AC32|nr:ABC transporter substrate-binding protein [Ruminococcus sp.]
MNTLKRTLALVATLAMAATSLASCGDKTEEKTDSKPETTTAAKTEDNGGDTDDKKSDEKVFTVAAWNHDDAPYLIAQWKGLSFDSIVSDLADDKVDGVHFIDMGVGGGQAAEKYDQMFNNNEDLDVYFCEADWALKFVNDDTRTMALEDLGIGDDAFPNLYSYTDDIGKATSGSNAGKRVGVSWQAAAGGFYYRADLAQQYLGVNNPDEMQEKIGSWDKFVAAAQSISEQTNKGVALADTLGGLWQAYACGRTTPWVKDNKVEIDASCEDFAKTAKALWDCGGITKNNQWTDEWTAAGVTGNVMGYFVSTWGFGGFALTAAGGKDGDQYGKWAVCQGPVPFYWGGTWIVVNPASDNKDEAKEFILATTSDEASMKDYAVKKPEYVNNSKVMDDLIASDTVFNEDITGNFVDKQNYFKALADNAKKINFNGLITPYDSTLKGAFQNAVKDKYLEGATWEETVDEFLNKAAEAAPDLDVD